MVLATSTNAGLMVEAKGRKIKLVKASITGTFQIAILVSGKEEIWKSKKASEIQLKKTVGADVYFNVYGDGYSCSLEYEVI